MKYRELDEQGDYALGCRRFLSGREAVAQAIKTRLYLLYGEWWENTEDGLPLFEKILGTYGGEEARQTVDLIISARIQGTTDVVALLAYDSTFDASTRRYEASCIVNTAYGIANLTMSDNLRSVEVSY